MRLERKINLGGFQSMTFASSEHPTVKECAWDLVLQMKPMSQIYPPVKAIMTEIQREYGV